MFLPNPFPDRVRLLYLYEYACHQCHRSGKGLELNHIFGRGDGDNVAFAASLLCPECHSHVGHSQEEHQRLVWMNMRFLVRIRYEPVPADYEIFERYPYLLQGEAYEKFRTLSPGHF